MRTSTPGPFAQLLGFELVHADAEGAEMAALPRAEHCNGGGILHGGYLSALLDSATGWAVHGALAPGQLAPHVHLDVQYLRAGRPDEPLRATARCLRRGRTILAAEAEITQGGRLLAKATSTHAVLR